MAAASEYEHSILPFLTFMNPNDPKRAANLVRLVKRVKRVIRGIIPRPQRGYVSETSKCRSRLEPFCKGYGVDLGFGGDPINLTAIRVDNPHPYANTGTAMVQLGGDAADLHWFRDSVLDYVYSSHLLEDFIDTKAVLIEWLRVLKPGGSLVIFCPDEQIYREHCRKTGQPYNVNHKHADFSLLKVREILNEIGGVEVVHAASPVDVYSWELVARRRRV